VHVTSKDSEFAREAVKADTEHGEAVCGYAAVAESGRGLAGGGVTGKLEVAESAFQEQLRPIYPGVLSKYRDFEGTVGRKAGNGAVIELNFCPAVLPGRDLSAFKQRGIYVSRVCQDLTSQGNLDVAFHIAQACSASIGICLPLLGTWLLCLGIWLLCLRVRPLRLGVWLLRPQEGSGTHQQTQSQHSGGTYELSPA